MQKLGMIQAYSPLNEGQDAIFVHPQGNLENSRLIKFRLLAETDIRLFVVPVEYDYDLQQVTVHHDEPDFTLFLSALKPGFEEIEFYYRGSFCLRVTGGNVWLDTYDNTALNIEGASTESYARLWEREERDPRILEIERAARHNTMMLQQQMEADRAQFAAMMEQMKNVTQAPASGTAGTPSVSSDAGTPVPASAPAGDPPAAPAVDGGTGGQS
jgi:hypothetical protein